MVKQVVVTADLKSRLIDVETQSEGLKPVKNAQCQSEAVDNVEDRSAGGHTADQRNCLLRFSSAESVHHIIARTSSLNANGRTQGFCTVSSLSSRV